MRMVVAVLIGARRAAGGAVVLVHDVTMTRQAPARVLYDDGSG